MREREGEGREKGGGEGGERKEGMDGFVHPNICFKFTPMTDLPTHASHLTVNALYFSQSSAVVIPVTVAAVTDAGLSTITCHWLTLILRRGL
jgi:hypothetical protein